MVLKTWGALKTFRLYMRYRYSDTSFRMPKAIQDDLTTANLSRARKWQIRQERKGLCIQCRRKAVKYGRCRVHVAQHLKLKKRNYQAKPPD